MARYTIGVDFGTLSGRALLVDTSDGRECASAVMDYPHGVMESAPGGTPIPDFALQHPADYMLVLQRIIREVIEKSGVSPGEIVGIGIDFTACTVLPVLQDGTPVCLLPEYENDPHAYVKLWKHHGGQPQADRLTALAAEREEEWMGYYGGKISSEWLFPKLLETYEKSPEVYAKSDYFIEAGDWIVWQLTGKLVRSTASAGYKGQWMGSWPEDFIHAAAPGFDFGKLAGELKGLAVPAGTLTSDSAELLDLMPGTVVSVASIDGHTGVHAAGVCTPGSMAMVIGTSTCHLMLSDQMQAVPGLCGVVRDGIIPGMYGYEGGQSCVGDGFQWFIEHCVPAAYTEEAASRGISIHALLREKAMPLKPGESGLVALDWFNGNRSVLADADLSGLIVGLNLQTRPEEIYRALIEATAYGTRKIIEAFAASGIEVGDLVAAGGIPRKDPMAMQIYADVLGRPVKVAATTQGGALGSAIFAAVAANCYPDTETAVKAMVPPPAVVYDPIPENVESYDTLYAVYSELHDWYGRGGSDVMKKLRAIRAERKKEQSC